MRMHNPSADSNHGTEIYRQLEYPPSPAINVALKDWLVANNEHPAAHDIWVTRYASCMFTTATASRFSVTGRINASQHRFVIYIGYFMDVPRRYLAEVQFFFSVAGHAETGMLAWVRKIDIKTSGSQATLAAGKIGVRTGGEYAAILCQDIVEKVWITETWNVAYVTTLRGDLFGVRLDETLV